MVILDRLLCRKEGMYYMIYDSNWLGFDQVM